MGAFHRFLAAVAGRKPLLRAIKAAAAAERSHHRFPATEKWPSSTIGRIATPEINHFSPAPRNASRRVAARTQAQK
jgi:hypothetical protein